jgi:Zn-dependent protease with chaperone function
VITRRSFWLLGSALCAGLVGCTTIPGIFDPFGNGPPLGIDKRIWAIVSTVAIDLSRMQREYPEEEQYYLGKAVAARALASVRGDMLEMARHLDGAVTDSSEAIAFEEGVPFSSPTNDDEAANRYVNLIAQSLALYSSRPELYEGYRVQILDTQALNAFSSPGGHIMVSSGILQCCASEDEVAAILAHEVAHVSLRHGVRNISRKTWITMGVNLIKSSVSEFGGASARELANGLDSAVADVAEGLVDRGYDHKFEFEADLEALQILRRSGYDPAALVSILSVLDNTSLPGRLGLTHPDPRERIRRIIAELGTVDLADIPDVRKKRFDRVRARF